MNSAYSRLKQLYLGFIPIYPLGYIMVHGFRGDQVWSKIYVNRSSIEPSEQLKELVEQEIDKMTNLKKAKFHVSLTDDMQPKVYGGLFLTNGAELQFPLRLSLDDVETTRRCGANLEVDLGLSKYRRKVEVNSDAGDELISRLMLSDSAKRFCVQRELQIANSGEFFCAPIFAWFTISSIGYGIFNGIANFGGPWLAVFSAVGFTLAGFRQFSRSFEGYKMRKADEQTVKLGEEYLLGAIDYLKSSMKLNRLIRQVLGEEGEKQITKSGDSLVDPIPISTRIREIRKISRNLSKNSEDS
ncbi:unnamed protein product [Caenorhabditis angaria]|uniref:Uncharacterized protein n=1 Tax=Caenorhabditis angaria TaxID=860376 RepID=A0A9P1IHB5_9PELO|nr:unnamed protein product [Caenorhabditis angaria]